MMLLPVVLIIGVVAYASGWRPQFLESSPARAGQTPLELLKARYARGEITRDEYDQVRRDLES